MRFIHVWMKVISRSYVYKIVCLPNLYRCFLTESFIRIRLHPHYKTMTITYMTALRHAVGTKALLAFSGCTILTRCKGDWGHEDTGSESFLSHLLLFIRPSLMLPSLNLQHPHPTPYSVFWRWQYEMLCWNKNACIIW